MYVCIIHVQHPSTNVAINFPGEGLAEVLGGSLHLPQNVPTRPSLRSLRWRFTRFTWRLLGVGVHL